MNDDSSASQEALGIDGPGYRVESPMACADQIKRLRSRLLRLLSRREYSQHELRNRLLAPSRKDGSRANPVAVEEAILWAADCDLQSDERFVEALIRRSSPRHGLSKIRAQLKVHKIDPELINTSLTGLHESEFNRAQALWEGRFGVKPASEREKARQFRFLLSRGFRNETVLQVLRGVQR
ncbi:MAG: regulatory protein RecX [Burkholderiaceae bacterium]